jgi:hypothetical protein
LLFADLANYQYFIIVRPFSTVHPLIVRSLVVMRTMDMLEWRMAAFLDENYLNFCACPNAAIE